MTKEGIEQLKRHEGLRLQAYFCPASVLTIGYGHTAGVKEGQTITLEDAEYLLSEDINEAEIGARSLFDNWYSFSPVRQDAVINLVFNLGKVGLSKFKTFIRCMKSGQWDAAAGALVHSKWYGQVGQRARDVVEMIREG